MPLKMLRTRKGVASTDNLLDFMGKEELAANLFRITQTEAKIKSERIRGQQALEDTAFAVGREVRNTMQRISGTRPENLPVTEDIKSVKKTLKKTQREFVRIDKK